MSAPWLVAMDWRDALFVHWPVRSETLRARIPRDLDLDVFDGTAWIGIVAFRIAAARARGVPARLGLRSFGEINVRTYVTGGGTPGVWFLSLDAASALTVEGGRTALHLPYYRARITTHGTARRAHTTASAPTVAPRPHASPPTHASRARNG
ncbi:MAG TPA: DUF2071 domain-containing protein, partial [Candidatus Elarobacter sp.]